VIQQPSADAWLERLRADWLHAERLLIRATPATATYDAVRERCAIARRRYSVELARFVTGSRR
jgi:hypothetical protein